VLPPSFPSVPSLAGSGAHRSDRVVGIPVQSTSICSPIARRKRRE
jgi:hypothetical protein